VHADLAWFLPSFDIVSSMTYPTQQGLQAMPTHPTATGLSCHSQVDRKLLDVAWKAEVDTESCEGTHRQPNGTHSLDQPLFSAPVKHTSDTALNNQSATQAMSE